MSLDREPDERAGAASKADGPLRGMGCESSAIRSIDGVWLSQQSAAFGTQRSQVQLLSPRSFPASSKVERPAVNRTDPGASPGRGAHGWRTGRARRAALLRRAPPARGVRCKSSAIRRRSASHGVRRQAATLENGVRLPGGPFSRGVAQEQSVAFGTQGPRVRVPPPRDPTARCAGELAGSSGEPAAPEGEPEKPAGRAWNARCAPRRGMGCKSPAFLSTYLGTW